jgi:hypothetical protein
MYIHEHTLYLSLVNMHLHLHFRTTIKGCYLWLFSEINMRIVFITFYCYKINKTKLDISSHCIHSSGM